MSIGSLAIVEEWLDAVNRVDGVRLEQLTHEEVQISGPRGSARADRRVLSEWLTRAGFSAEVLRWFCGSDGRVVVEQDARWVDIETGQEQGRARVASRFLVAQGRIVTYVRHDDGLTAALTAARLGGGVYEDRYQRQYGVWRITSRVVRRPFDLQPLPASHGIVGI